MKKNDKLSESSCDTCEFYDWDEELEEYACMANLDEDDLWRAASAPRCPFYKYYNEYKSVQKQN